MCQKDLTKKLLENYKAKALISLFLKMIFGMKRLKKAYWKWRRKERRFVCVELQKNWKEEEWSEADMLDIKIEYVEEIERGMK